jgi:hypothetical protein
MHIFIYLFLLLMPIISLAQPRLDAVNSYLSVNSLDTSGDVTIGGAVNSVQLIIDNGYLTIEDNSGNAALYEARFIQYNGDDYIDFQNANLTTPVGVVWKVDKDATNGTEIVNYRTTTNLLAGYLPLTGGKMTGDIDFDEGMITNIFAIGYFADEGKYINFEEGIIGGNYWEIGSATELLVGGEFRIDTLGDDLYNDTDTGVITMNYGLDVDTYNYTGHGIQTGVDATNDLQVVNYRTATNLLAGYLPLTGGTMSGELDLGGENIINVAEIGFFEVYNLYIGFEEGYISGNWQFSGDVTFNQNQKVTVSLDATNGQEVVNYRTATNLLSGYASTQRIAAIEVNTSNWNSAYAATTNLGTMAYEASSNYYLASNPSNFISSLPYAKYHLIDSNIFTQVDTWENISFDFTPPNENSGDIDLTNNDTLEFNFNGLVQINGCLRPTWQGTNPGSATLYSRIIWSTNNWVSTNEARCLQSEGTRERLSGQGDTIHYKGSLAVTTNTKIRLQGRVTDVDLILQGHSVFDNPVSATINIFAIDTHI